MFFGYQQWEAQFFQNVKKIVPNLEIPVSDEHAYMHFPAHNWVYNKLELMRIQNIEAHPHGVVPQKYPVFSKPIYNFWGMSIGAKIVYFYTDLDYTPGHFWMPVLFGKQLTVDLAVVQGEIKWFYIMRSQQSKDQVGQFDYFIAENDQHEDVIDHLKSWISEHMSDYTGMLNFETIDKVIIECHLRFGVQYTDLYGEAWLENVVKLYSENTWEEFQSPSDGVSYVVRVKEYGRYRINWDRIRELEQKACSIQFLSEDQRIIDSNLRDSTTDNIVAIVNTHSIDSAQIIEDEIIRTGIKKLTD